MKRVFINLLSVIVIIFILLELVKLRSNIFVMDNSKMYYLTTYGTGVTWRVDSDNVVNCNLVGVSNAILKLKEEGYSISKEIYKKEFFDIILVKGDSVYRLYYTSDGNLTSIAKPYKNSSIPVTYIDGGEM